MKKIFLAVLCAVITFLSAFGAASCGQNKDGIFVCAPDGATALALAGLINGEAEFDREVNYEIVNAENIHTYVTGKNPKSDICILPLNRASILLGDGSAYKMLGAVTHGNLFIMKKEGLPDITVENLGSLVGKTVGVMQLNNVPGLTFRLILNDNGIAFNVFGNDGATDSEKVNLKAVTATEVIPSDKTCDYFVVPEPAASAKQKATAGKLSVAGSLQTLYGGGNGYPQAVLVAKLELISSSPSFIEKFTAAVSYNAEWLLDGETSVETVVNAVNGKLTAGMSPSLTVQNVTKDVIRNCAIRFVKAADCKAEVNSFISKLVAVEPAAAKAVSDAFFHI